MLLVFAMALSFVPASAFAAYYHEVDIGDIANEYIADNGVTYDYTGKTGLKGNIDTSDTISWPIRIYDYLNDGMLFEYPNASYVGDIPDGQGGAYGGGTPAPHFTGAKNVIGIDYTTSGAYGEYAYANWLSQKYSAKDSSVETVKTKVEAVNFKDPMHLQVYYPTQQSDRSKSHVWVSDFANDNQKYYSKEDIRYVVVVYRTNDVYAQSQSYRDSDDVTWNDKTYGPGTIQFHWAVSDSKRDSDYDYHVSSANSSLVSGGTRLIDISDLGDNLVSNGTISGPSITLPASTNEWGYMVYDMCDPNVDSDVKAKWNTKTTVNGNSMDTIGAERIAGVKMTIPINDQGEEIYISHIAYFGTKFEAEQFGKDAVAFDNDPGEYLDSHVEYTSRPIVTPVAKPSVTNNGMDFTSIGSGGYNVDTYKKWSTAQYGNSYLGYANGVKVKEVNNDPRSYVSIGNYNNSSNRSLYIWQLAEGGLKSELRYITIVYKTTNFTSNQDVSFYLKNGNGGANLYTNGVSGTAASTRITLAKSEGVWTYITYDLAQIANGDSDYYAYNYATEIGFYLPTCLTGSANSNRSLDIAFTMLQGTSLAQAKSFGQQAADYMNGKTVTSSGNSYTTAQKKWNTGNNVAYSLLYANQGGGWGNVAGGESTQENGYFSYQIGATPWSSDSATETNNDRQTAKSKGYTVADDIYLLNSWQMVSGSAEYYDMKSLDLGYTLYNKLYSGVMTAGLLESGITTVTANGRAYRVPQYKEETIEYIAYLLRDSLCIGKTDSNGNYNYNFVQGTPNGAQYGYDANGKPYDLASALRAELGINLPTNGNCTSGYASVGDYATMTDAQKKALIGPYMSCKDNINTFVDAAYYLLMNLYIDNSYNQAQDEYKYLVLSSATLESNNKKAYVFDGGFTTGKASETANTDAYRHSSKSATVYDKNKQSIYQSTATSKDKIYFSGASTTTRFPFLPITDSEGVYAGETKSPYFLDDGNGVMGVTEEGATFVNRNYNYAIASNGEFIYYEEDALFFDFEGDDDVYLFINGELVVDVGAAHSVTTVSMNVKDYVDWAKGVLADLDGYDPNMSNRQMEELLNSKNLTDAKKAEYLRAHRLNLQDGEICQFDFYYMERHGWGANCRIASNIRVTEPAMRVEKHAYQGGDEIAYSDVIVASDPVEYNFKMINNGSSKLFNLTFTDSTIGVTLDYTNGLTVADGFNGVYVFDANGGTLEASDITALVTGWMPVESGGTHIKDIDGNYVEDANGTHVYTSIENTFKTQQELKNFLASLQGEGLDNTELDTTFLQSGYGLWVDADVTFKGIYYKLSVEQVEVGVLDNTVYVTATSMPKPNASGNQILQSQARHRVYITGLPYYYQWAGHNLYLPMDDIMADAIEAAKDSGNQAHEYESFLNSIQGKTYNYALCDKFGAVKSYQEVIPNSSKTGYIVNYPEAGTKCFYILVSSETITSTTKAKDLTTGKYAIIRITVFVADVEDSYYVLDYGLTTEDLGTNGELFKNDYLFGGSSDNHAKMMGIATTQPSYLSYPDQTAKYNRIQFSAVPSNTSIPVGDGYYTMQIQNGKDISFNSYTGKYSLTDVGTVKVNVYTPTDWTDAYLYFWYDGGSNNGWPGAKMEKVTAGQFKIDVPADITHVIISNGSQQTGNLMITPGVENTIKVTKPSGDSLHLDAEVATFTPATVTITVPDGWGDVHLYCWNSVNNKNNGEWPGTKLEAGPDGKYTTTIAGSYDRMIVNNGNGNGKQTNDLWVTAGANLTLDVTVNSASAPSVVTVNVPGDWGDVYLYCWGDNGNNGEWPGTKIEAEFGRYQLSVPSQYNNMIVNNGSGKQTGDLKGLKTNHNLTINVADTDNVKITETDKYSADVNTYSSVTEKYNFFVETPSTWTNAHLYYWNSNGVVGVQWPGTKLTTKTEDGLYAVQIPVDTAYVIVNNGEGSYQTVDLSVKLGVEATVSVTNPGADGNYLASIDYHDDFTFTPSDFMDSTYSIWMAITVHNNSLEAPTALNNPIDVAKEVQLYKKISVLPANVVYYEDDFPAITYEQSSGNVFTPIGSSSDLSQSVDQDQEYGQDDAYQNNSDMSGNSLHVIDICKYNVAASFQFTGTGFELIGRTNADDSASIVVEVLDSSDKVIKRIPVITQFDNNETGKTPGGDESIYQVPVIRVDDLTKGQYTVRIKGVPSSSREHTYLYLDGIRIFQPLGSANEHYNEAENNAIFAEIRDLIVTGKAAVAKYDGNSMSVSSGTITWTENLTGKDITGLQEFEGNQVDNVNAYLLKGPNNEVYMNGTIENAALIFTVKKTTGTPALQIAVRAIDEAQFYIGSTTAPAEPASGMNAVIEFYAKQSDGSFAWEPLVTVTSGTEQYYSIDLTRCYTADGEILVAVRAKSGMASFTSLKYNNLTVEATTGAEVATYYYINGELAVCSCESKCASKDDAITKACPVCVLDYGKCAVPETVSEESEEEIERKEGGIQLNYLSYMMARPSLTDTTDAPDDDVTPDNQQPEILPDPENQPQQTPETTPEVDSGVQPEQKPAEKPDSSGSKPNSNAGNKPSGSDITAQVAAKIASIRNKLSEARNQMKDFVGEFNDLFR